MATAISSNLEEIILPKDVWGMIFSYLDDVNMAKVSCVSKFLNNFAEHYYWRPRLTEKKFLTVTDSKSAKGQLADYYNKYCNFFYKKLNLAKPSDKESSVFSHKYSIDKQLSSKDELPKIEQLLVNILQEAWKNPNKAAENLDKDLQILFDSGKCPLPLLLITNPRANDSTNGVEIAMSASLFIKKHCSPITISMIPEKK